MKLKKPSFKIRGKKNQKEEIIEIAEEPKLTVETTPVEVENDPIIEDREDADETNATPSPSASVEEETNEMDDEERSPPDDDEAVVMASDDDEAVVKAADDDSAMTDLSTVKEEPSNEETEENAAEEIAEEAAPPAEKEQDECASFTQMMDREDLTLDASTISTLHETGYTKLVHAPAFCGCFGG